MVCVDIFLHESVHAELCTHLQTLPRELTALNTLLRLVAAPSVAVFKVISANVYS